jgi:septal ring factor EnvC (AmiA/AmiB activator)
MVASLVIAPLAMAANKAASEKQLKSVLGKIEKLKQVIDVKEDSKSKYISS